MADPISAEPNNWEDDIILKITMPGKSLRESTKIKQKQADLKNQRVQETMKQAKVQSDNIVNPKPEVIQPIQNQVYKPQQSKVEESSQQSLSNFSESVEESSEQDSNLDVQPQEIPQQPDLPKSIPVEDMNIQDDLSITQSEPEQVDEAQQIEGIEAPEEVSNEVSEEAQIDSQEAYQEELDSAQEIEEEPIQESVQEINAKKSEEKIKIMTIEPEKEITVKNLPAHLSESIDIKKIEGFANRLIGSDLAYRNFKRR
ncbi:MAG: hypothetical protein AABY07_07590 [Nanoarchaeota archaeon]